MLWTLCAWEDNLYHDSYFYEGYYDDVSKELVSHEVGATAYASSGFKEERKSIAIAPNGIIEECRALMASKVEILIREAYKSALHPEDAHKGMKVVLESKAKHKGVDYPAGTTGTVFWCGTFGTFYAKGYNRPGRHNRRVGLTLADGSTAYFALSKLARTDLEPYSDAEMKASAQRIVARESDFIIKLFPCKAWLSSNNWIEIVKCPAVERLKDLLTSQ